MDDSADIRAASPRPVVPGLVFDNRTPYAALQFDTLDQHGSAFHIFVAKIGYRLSAYGPDGLSILTILDEPAQLNTEDLHVDGDPAASMLEESDLAPFKPRCDVIVNAVAHAPGGIAVAQFSVGLRLDKQGAGEVLIKKDLVVCGKRRFKRKPKITRAAQWPLRILTLGLIHPNAWTLGRPGKLTTLPLRYEYANGGQCRIGQDEVGASRIPARNRLPASGNAAAHEACQGNPIGLGFTRNWYLKALRCKSVQAPQISDATQSISARQFQACANGDAELAPAGMGPVGRAWLPRRALIGHIEEKPDWGSDEVPALPEDFDYGYWNCAPADQQCPYLQGGERITLANLCDAGNPAARADQRGNTVLRFDLPSQAMFILAVNASNQLTVLPLVIDTVVISPETRRVDLVWRGCLAADPSLVEARLMHVAEHAQIDRLKQLIEHQWSGQPGESAALGKG